MSHQTSLKWLRDGRRKIFDSDLLIAEHTFTELGWTTVEPRFSTWDSQTFLVCDGQLSGAAISSVIEIAPPSLSFEANDPIAVSGREPWLIGRGLALHPGARTELDAFIWNTRVLTTAEAGLSGTLAPVRYAGWRSEHEGGEEHYLKMVAYGTTRDPNLTPYLSAGFWIAGRAADQRIAFLARPSD